VKLEYNGQETIPAKLDTVWAFLSDPEKVGRCLPEVVDVAVQDASHFVATVRVAVGPVRGNFKLKCELQPDAEAHRMNIKVSGGGFGSSVDMTGTADVVDPGDGTTTLNWRGTAEVRGPVAAVGGRVLDAQARKLIEQTFTNVRETLTT
jgi:uncharacterized protein